MLLDLYLYYVHCTDPNPTGTKKKKKKFRKLKKEDFNNQSEEKDTIIYDSNELDLPYWPKMSKHKETSDFFQTPEEDPLNKFSDLNLNEPESCWNKKISFTNMSDLDKVIEGDQAIKPKKKKSLDVGTSIENSIVGAESPKTTEIDRFKVENQEVISDENFLDAKQEVISDENFLDTFDDCKNLRKKDYKLFEESSSRPSTDSEAENYKLLEFRLRKKKSKLRKKFSHYESPVCISERESVSTESQTSSSVSTQFPPRDRKFSTVSTQFPPEDSNEFSFGQRPLDQQNYPHSQESSSQQLFDHPNRTGQQQVPLPQNFVAQHQLPLYPGTHAQQHPEYQRFPNIPPHTVYRQQSLLPNQGQSYPYPSYQNQFETQGQLPLGHSFPHQQFSHHQNSYRYPIPQLTHHHGSVNPQRFQYPIQRPQQPLHPQSFFPQPQSAPVPAPPLFSPHFPHGNPIFRGPRN